MKTNKTVLEKSELHWLQLAGLSSNYKQTCNRKTACFWLFKEKGRSFGTVGQPFLLQVFHSINKQQVLGRSGQKRLPKLFIL